MNINSNGTFGRKSSDTWKPWKYTHRLKVAKEVEKFKQTVNKKNVTEKTKRSNITAFIAKQRSRQEFIPLVEKMIDQAHIEPLHLKNNACAWHMLFLNIIGLISSLLEQLTAPVRLLQLIAIFDYTSGKIK